MPNFYLIKNEAKHAQQQAQKAANFGLPGIVGHQIAHQLHQTLGLAGLLVADTFVGLASFPIRNFYDAQGKGMKRRARRTPL